ncbi:nuclear transport factor 2 family protein [Frateuria defendens]|uniref:nuclear transport factor 2 family protein n=1 Tax=Frateuria defendens TaxID=2219559 RepID=UPI00069F002A|nr:nuclear transport factor 2 family protein [Frateuria defendens]
MRAIGKAVTGFAAAFIASLALAAPADAPGGHALLATITALDRTVFDAYNRCDLRTFARYIAPDIEFYHDKGGLTLGREKLVESLRQGVCGKLRRELVAGTLEVYPIKGFGAVETGSHRFCALSTGRCDALARFVHLWAFHDGAWRISRVISYDHHAAP